MSTPKIMFYLTVCPGGAVQAPEKHLLSTQQEFIFLKFSSLTVSSRLIALGNLGHSSAAPALEDLRRLNQEIQTNAFAIRTKKNLCSMWKAYAKFCAMYRLSEMPATGEALCLFATWLFVAARVHTAQSVRNYLSAVRTCHRANGLDCPTPSSFTPLNLTIRGLERRFSNPIRRMAPITPNILVDLVQYPRDLFGTEWRIFTVIRSLYIHLFFSMLRLDNMVPQSTGSFDCVVHLVWGRVVQLGQGVVLRAIHTKQIQNRQRTLEIPLVAKPGSQVCPVAAFHTLLQIPGYPQGESDPVYNIPGKDGGWVPLSRYQVVSVLAAQIKKLGLDPTLYRPHAFRRGGIQLAVRLVSNFELVRIHSDHASDAIEAYTNLPPEHRYEVTAQMMNAF